jgi:ABC-type bacteriocin/lantibiotic exporter with double-glycine peptidase domain
MKRVLIRPAVLVLDEATANLDLNTEAEVHRAMRARRAGASGAPRGKAPGSNPPK